MKRTLLTGFGPFGIIENNPAQRLVEHFASQGAAGHELSCHVFPVSYTRVALQVEEVLGTAGDVPFDNVVMLGVHGGSKVWRIERVGTNADTSRSTDMDGVLGSESIIPGHPNLIQTSLPVVELVDALNAESLPAVASDSAGGYLCNHLLFRMLLRLEGQTSIRAGFVHIPPDPITYGEKGHAELVNARPFDLHVRAIEVVLRELAYSPIKP